jgi:hypothetical protein
MHTPLLPNSAKRIYILLRLSDRSEVFAAACAGQKVALDSDDFECSTRLRTFKISAAFYGHPEGTDASTSVPLNNIGTPIDSIILKYDF